MNPDLAGAIWRKSSRSGGENGQCVELAHGDSVAGVRDSKNPGGPVLTFGQAELTRFLTAVKSGRLHG
ncbi:DUF397 domain-containing protein [Goodfellowiella coeruleoviolacea]|uniref:DUF397 domain-containing protein n=1 Tax=Goodfellowiella coeruleoviolacea TaxID=334858 RepID=A0AAE3KFE0_9PSEU|nr:DUF397 domain-containing protein [Goodfellowiella coeruleoviolacea]MCP2164855.1 protein of unknown function (DUF397) [Goodfellowiella coeruleoviolacea]